MKSLPFLFCTLGCLLLSSCFDIREEIWLDSNGSGRAEMSYVVPAGALGLIGGESGLRQKVQELIDSEPELHLDDLTITSTGGDTIISLKASTDSMISLIDMQDNEVIRSLPKAASGFAGEFNVKLDGLAINFDRRIDLQKALGLASLAISADQRRMRSLNYIVHLPNQPESHNATRTADKGRTLIWEHTLGDALTNPVTTSFLVKIPIPWWVYAGLSLLLGLIAWAISKVWRRRQASK